MGEMCGRERVDAPVGAVAFVVAAMEPLDRSHPFGMRIGDLRDE